MNHKINLEKNYKVVASIEARMGSTRLPGKVLKDVCGLPALSRQLNRLKLCNSFEEIILATSFNKKDDILENWALNEGIECYRGSEDDVLNRVVNAHRKMKSDIIVQTTGDCPLIDPDIIDLGVNTFMQNSCDVVLTKNTYPGGLDVLVYKASILEDNEKTISDPLVREHVAYYLVRHPELYNTINLVAPKRWNEPSLELTLDYPVDLDFIRAIYSELEPLYGEKFGVEEILNLLKEKPYLRKINVKRD